MLFDELFNDFFDDFNFFTEPSYTKTVKKCPTCGRSWADFQHNGRLGCSDCYKTFKPQITQVIAQIHSNSQHTGKIPSKSGESLKKKRLYQDLKQQLSDAVKAEDYEKAAKLHKQIRELESEVK